MEFEFSEGRILFERELSDLDRFVLKFVEILNGNGVKYVIVSGYVSILFGRSRVTEDIDVFVEKVGLDDFLKLVKSAEESGMWIVNEIEAGEAYGMLEQGMGVRVGEVGKAIPNFEMKFPKKETDRFPLENPLKAVVGGKEIRISPLELQIAYKLYLGSDKDVEDALYIYEIFNKHIDAKILGSMLRKLGVEEKAEKYGIG